MLLVEGVECISADVTGDSGASQLSTLAIRYGAVAAHMKTFGAMLFFLGVRYCCACSELLLCLQRVAVVPAVSCCCRILEPVQRAFIIYVSDD